MRVKLSGIDRIAIVGEFIKLDALLKYASIALTGGEAKKMIQSGRVYIGGERCTERGKKVKPGQIVRCGQNVLLVKQAVK